MEREKFIPRRILFAVRLLVLISLILSSSCAKVKGRRDVPSGTGQGNGLGNSLRGIGPGTSSNPPVAIGLRGPSQIPTGKWAGPFAAFTMDAQGKEASVFTSLTITLRGEQSGGFALDPEGTAQVSSLFIPSNRSAREFYFFIKNSADLVIQAVDLSFKYTNASLGVSVRSETPRKLMVDGSTTSQMGSCRPYGVRVEDANGSESSLTSDTSISLSVVGGTGNFSLSSSCAPSTQKLLLTAGTSSGIVYFNNTSGGNLSLKFTDDAATLTEGNISLELQGTPTKVAVVGPSVAGLGKCVLYSLVTRDAQDKSANLTIGRMISVSQKLGNGANGSLLTFSDWNCKTGASIFTIDEGRSSKTFYVKATKEEDLILTPSEGSGALAGVLLPILARPGAAVRIQIDGLVEIGVNQCAAYTARSVDLLGYSSKLFSTITLNLSENGSGVFYPISSCTGAGINQLTLNSGNSSVLFYFRDTASESVFLVAEDTSPATPLESGTIGVMVKGVPHHFGLTGPSPVPKDTCISGYNVSILDVNGSPANLTYNLIATVTVSAPAVLYKNDRCTLTFSLLDLGPTTNPAPFYFKSGTAGTYTINVRHSGTLLPTAMDVIVGETEPTKLVLDGPATFYRGQCSPTPYTITTTDGSGKLTPVTKSTDILVTDGATGGFFSDSSCLLPRSVFTISKNSSAVNFYYRDNTRGSRTLTAADQSGQLTPASKSIELLVPPPIAFRLAVVNPVKAGSCRGPFTVSRVDSVGNASDVEIDTFFTLVSSSAKGMFHAQDSCSTPANTVITRGTSSQFVYYRDENLGTQTITVDDGPGGLTAASGSVTVTAGDPKQLVIASGPDSLSSGQCSSPYTLKLKDAFGNDTVSPTDLRVDLSFLPANPSGKFFTSAGCTGETTSLTIQANQNSIIYYFKDTLPGTLTMKAVDEARLLSEATKTVTINALPPVRLAIQGPSTIDQSLCSASYAYRITRYDANGGESTPNTATSINFVSKGRSVVYGASGCSSPISSTAILAGSASVTVYLKDDFAETFAFIVDDSGGPLLQASLMIQVAPKGPSKLEWSGPTRIQARTCNKYILTAKDGTGVPTNVLEDTIISIGSLGSWSFHLDDVCSPTLVRVDKITMKKDTSSINVWGRDPIPESVGLTAFGPNLGSASYTVIVNPSPPLRLKINAVAILPERKLLGAGYFGDASTNETNMGVGRFLPDGTLDSSFGDAGYVRVSSDVRRFDMGKAIAVYPSGNFVVTGWGGTHQTADIVVWGFDSEGNLDSSFGNSGVVVTDLGTPGGQVADYAVAVAIQPDGKIVVAGSTYDYRQTNIGNRLFVVRYLSNGILDSSFSGDGKVISTGGNSYGQMALGLQKDGKILVSSSLGSGFHVSRFTTTGEIDSTFGSSGTTISVVSGRYDYSTSVIENAGKIIVGGHMNMSGTTENYDWVLIQFSANGVFEKQVTTDLGSNRDYLFALGLQSDGKIVAAGKVKDDGQNMQFAIARYTSTLTLDTTFGQGGKEVTTFSPGDYLSNSLRIENGIIIAAGIGRLPDVDDIALSFPFPTGETGGAYCLDTTFGVRGKTTQKFSVGREWANDAIVQEDGKIIVVGTVYDNTTIELRSNSKWGIIRFNPDGSLDTSFGVGGKTDFEFTSFDDRPSLVGIDHVTKELIVVGYSTNPNYSGQDFSGPAYYFSYLRLSGQGNVISSNKASLTNALRFSGIPVITMRKDGIFVAAGFSGNSMVIARFNVDGTIDTSFGNGRGFVPDTRPGNFVPHSIGISPLNNGIFLSGYDFASPPIGTDFAVVSYREDGSRNTAFGTNGEVITVMSPGPEGGDIASSIEVQTSGKILVGGKAFSIAPYTSQTFAMARYTPTGALDGSFGVGGKVFTDFGDKGSRIFHLRTQPDGKIFAVGFFDNDFAVAKYDSSGSLDPSFCGTGKTTTDFSPGSTAFDASYRGAFQSDGKLIAVGIATDSKFAVARYGASSQPKELVISPVFHDYGTRLVNTKTDKEFTLTNGTDQSVSLRAFDLSVTPFNYKGGSFPGVGGSCRSSLASRQNCTIVIQFSPIAGGSYNTTLRIDWDDGSGPRSVQATLEGVGLSPPATRLTIGDATDLKLGSCTEYSVVARDGETERIVQKDINVYLRSEHSSGGLAGNFFNNSYCSGYSVMNVTIPIGTSRTKAYFRPKLIGGATLGVGDVNAVLSPGMLAVTVRNDPYSKLKLGDALIIRLEECSPFTVQKINDTRYDANTYMPFGSGGTTIYPGSTLYPGDPTAIAPSSTYTGTAYAPSGTTYPGITYIAPTTAYSGVTYVAPDAYIGTTAGVSGTTGTGPSNYDPAITVALDHLGQGSGKFYFDDRCTNEIGQGGLSMPSGVLKKTFYYRNPIAQTVILRGTDLTGIYGIGTHQVTVQGTVVTNCQGNWKPIPFNFNNTIKALCAPQNVTWARRCASVGGAEVDLRQYPGYENYLVDNCSEPIRGNMVKWDAMCCEGNKTGTLVVTGPIRSAPDGCSALRVTRKKSTLVDDPATFATTVVVTAENNGSVYRDSLCSQLLGGAGQPSSGTLIIGSGSASSDFYYANRTLSPVTIGFKAADTAIPVNYTLGSLIAQIPGATPRQIQVSVTGKGSVTSSPSGISCPSNCVANFVHNSSVTLVATPQLGASFSGWTGACSGTGTCLIKPIQNVSVEAKFVDSGISTFSAWIIQNPYTNIMNTPPSVIIPQVGIPLTSAQLALVSTQDTQMLSGGTYHLFAIPAVGRTAIEWMGKATGNLQVFISVWNGSSWTIRDSRNYSGGPEVIVTSPVGTDQVIYLLVNCTNGSILTDYAGAAIHFTTGKLVLGPNETVPKDQCKQYLVRRVDQIGNDSNLTYATPIDLVSSSRTFFTDAACTLPTSGTPRVTIAAGSASVPYYFKSTIAGTYTVTANDVNQKFSSATQSLTVALPRATQLSFSGSSSLGSGRCQVYFINSLNDSGQATAVLANTAVTLTGQGSGAFFVGSTCVSPVSTVTIPSGQSTVQFAFKDDVAELLTWNASATGLRSASYSVFVSDIVGNLNLLGPTKIKAGECLYNPNWYQVEARNVVTPSTVNLSTGGNGSFYSGADCRAALSSVQIYPQSTSVFLAYRATTPGIAKLTADGGTFGKDSLDVVVEVGTVGQLVWSSTSQLVQNSCTPFTVSRNLNGQLVTTGSTDVQLSGQGTTGAFYTDFDCGIQNLSGRINIPNGVSYSYVYFKSTTIGSYDLTATDIANPVQYIVGSKSITVGPGSAGRLSFGVTPKNVVNMGECVQYDITRLNGSGQPDNSSLNTTVSMSSAPTLATATLQFYRAGCAVAATDFVIPSGQSTVATYFKASGSLSTNLLATVSANDFSGNYSVSRLPVTVVPLKGVLALSGPTSLLKGRCYDYTLTLPGDSSALVVVVTDGSTGTFHSGIGCASISSTTLNIAPLARSFLFSYRPSGAGSFTLTASTAGYTAGTLAVSVTSYPTDLLIVPNRLDFGSLAVNSTSNLTIRVTNVGTGIVSNLTEGADKLALPFVNLVENRSAGSFVGVGGTCFIESPTLSPGLSCTIVVKFEPRALGQFTDTFNLAYTIGGAALQTAPISVTGVGGNATAGALDPSFGTGGKVTLSFGQSGEEVFGIAQQGDSKLVLSGYYTATITPVQYRVAMARLNADGSLDNTFGSGGKVTDDFGLGSVRAHTVAIQSDGKVIIAGYSYSSSTGFVARYTSTGARDTTFGTNGVTSMPAYLSDLVILPGGQVMVGGHGTNNGNIDFLVFRLTSIGTVDPTFGANGRASADIFNRAEYGYSLLVQSECKPIVAGQTYSSGTVDYDAGIVQFNSDGRTLDTTFGSYSNGKVQLNLGSNYDDLRSIALFSDGSLFFGGNIDKGTSGYPNYNFMVAKLTNRGIQASQVATTDFVGTTDYGRKLLLQSDGKVILVGGAWLIPNSVNAAFAIARYLPTLELDTSFGTNGKVTTDWSAYEDLAQTALIQSDGKLVAAGYAHTGTGGDNDFAVSRYLTGMNAKLVIPQPNCSGSGGGTSISAGNIYSKHSCGVVNGSIKCWGDNQYGQLGNSSTQMSLVPVQVEGITSGATKVAAGEGFTCAVVNGAAKCWGYNGGYQLGIGDGSYSNSLVPAQVSGLTSGVTDIATGRFHTCAVVNGAVKCWGMCGYGIGDGTTCSTTQTEYRSTPVQVVGLTSGVSKISVGAEFSCAIHNGSLKCWGRNYWGNLGNGSVNHSLLPVQVQGLTSGVSDVSCGTAQTCAVVNGSAKCWGYNSYGEIGTSTCNLISSAAMGSQPYCDTPHQVESLTSGVTAVTAGFSCAIANRSVYCWGARSEISTLYSRFRGAIPALLTGITNATILSTGYDYLCTVSSEGANCLGNNSHGQLGNGSQTSYSDPSPVSGF